ncbi:MAG: 2-oxoglutarate dehydrogenase [Clostridia bacterium]|nr:2-oxoglutarate dehydrogenase [Clostridia bacterium]
MFKYRYDGVFSKTADPILGITSHIMPKRYDAMVNFHLSERCEAMDEYIKKVAEEKDIKLTYMHIMVAAMVRMYAEKPILNRFVMNGRVFDRKGIYICFAMKKQLNEDAPEETIKIKFTGEETIFDIKRMIDEEVSKGRNANDNDAVKTAALLKAIPNGLTKFAVGTLKWMDKHGFMPHQIIDLSPFHASAWLTNMKSVSTEYVYHHLYDFGTSSLFVGLGKEKLEPVVNQSTGELEVGKMLHAGIVIDERICDGFYYAKSIKVIRKLLRNPELLEKPFELSEEQKLLNWPKDKVKSLKKEIKARKKAEKKENKVQKKQQKKTQKAQKREQKQLKKAA